MANYRAERMPFTVETQSVVPANPSEPLGLAADLCWQAVQARDGSRDGEFVYGVRSTGIYCRPSCASKRPLRQNTRFYATPGDAERAGLRACRRCCPGRTRSAAEGGAIEAVRAAAQALQADPAAPRDVAGMAAAAGLSVSHFHRIFRRLTGVTPRRYAEGLRMTSLKRQLKGGGNVAGSIYASGFGSGSRVYERSNTQLGMTPAQYRDGGRGVSITYVSVPSPLGRMMLGATDRGLCFLQFGDTSAGLLALLRREYPHAALAAPGDPAHPDLARWLEALQAYLEGSKGALELPLDVRATAFQLRVWDYLRGIPYGHVESYSEIAAKLGAPQSTRAVARAVASNRVALLVPCHRVIRNNGELGGFRWGLSRKRSLLDMERGASAEHRETADPNAAG